jgi:hypothetical protein
MKKLKIFTILILLSGFGTVYSQQSDAGLPEGLQKDKTVQQERTTLSPNPASVELTLEMEAIAKSAPSVTDDAQSPNPPDSGVTGQMVVPLQTEENTEETGPDPNNPNGIRPDTE